jgi:hypothetical protein
MHMRRDRVVIDVANREASDKVAVLGVAANICTLVTLYRQILA